MINRVTPKWITAVSDDEVFGFGSNLQGIHEKGAARVAKQWGAKRGKGQGLMGRTYAIPTRDYINGKFISLPLDEINGFVELYIRDAKKYSEKYFLTTLIGCGYAGYTPAQIAPMFWGAVDLENVSLPQEFWDLLNKWKEA